MFVDCYLLDQVSALERERQKRERQKSSTLPFPRIRVIKNIVNYLNSQPVFVDCDLLDQVSTLDPDFLLRHQVLDDHVGHVLEEKMFWSASVEKLERFIGNKDY